MEMKNIDWRPGPPMPSVCRCCLAEGCYKDISTEYFWMGKREVYSEMLSDTFDVSISYSTSAGPNSNSRLICELCISRLRDASEFKKQVFECEKTFKQHLDPGRIIVEIEPETVDKDVKLEDVKLEKKLSDVDDNIDDIFDADVGFSRDDDDDDDDMDNQPLVALASKKPKKESVDVQELLDSTVSHLKRKSGSKDKSSPRKKTKTSKLVAKTATTKTVAAEKKKKDECNFAKRNAEIIVQFATAYPFKLPEENLVCVFCGDDYNDSSNFRLHMQEEHKTFNVKVAFWHCHEMTLKVDISELRCRICCTRLNCLEDAAEHLHVSHDKKVNPNYDLGLQPFKFLNNTFTCAVCYKKSHSLRQLSKHTQTHFVKFTCESCGKSYSTKTALKVHIKYTHSDGGVCCRKCRKRFPTVQARKEHMDNSRKCWPYVCSICCLRYRNWTAKSTHMVREHGQTSKTYECRECGETFENPKKYYAHFRINHTDDHFLCTFCSQRFDTKRGLEDHVVIHTKDNWHPCPVCSKSFPRKKNLKQHMWMHSDIKRFECKPCNKKFNQKISWTTHMKSHHGGVANVDDVA